MTRIYFVRHGQSVANAGGVTMEHAAIPLSALGAAQATALARFIEVRPSRVFVSKYARAQATARPFCEKVGHSAEVHPLLHEFSALDPAMLEGMTGEQRRPIANAYWQAGDPGVRMGPQAETFLEFDARVTAFMSEMPRLPDQCVLFGHGIWFGLLCWKLLGFGAADSPDMKAFRRFQTGLPMPNCAVYALDRSATGSWRWQLDERTMRGIAAVRLPDDGSSEGAENTRRDQSGE